MAVATNPGHGAPGASDERLAVPVVARHWVTEPPTATCNSIEFTTPVPSPMVPLTDDGTVLPADCAKPLTSTRFASCNGLSKPTTVHVEYEPVARDTARCTPTK